MRGMEGRADDAEASLIKRALEQATTQPRRHQRLGCATGRSRLSAPEKEEAAAHRG